MFSTIIIIIILIVILINENKKKKELEEEIQRLIKELSVVKEGKETIIKPVEKVQTEIKVEKAQKPEVKIEAKPQVKRSDKEIKNITILTTGAIFIVLAAIVFLMSTWSIIPNLLKTAVLLLLTAVFFGGSYVAKNKFQLEKTSQAFFYIAMAYIPICLLSISVFRLLGEYLSIFGEGKYIYLTLSSLFVAAVYYYVSRRNDNNYLLVGSILSQVLSMVMLSLILSTNLFVIFVNLLLYNLLFILLTKKEMLKKLYMIIPITTFCIGIFGIFNPTLFTIMFLLVLAINFLILELKNSSSLYSYLLNISLILFGINVFNLFLVGDSINTKLYHILIVSYILLVYVIESLLLLVNKRKFLLNSLFVVVISSISFLHLKSIIFPDLFPTILKSHIIASIQIVLLGITYFKSGKVGKAISTFLITCYFIIAGLGLFSYLKLSYHFYVLFSLFTFIIGELFRRKNKEFYLYTFITSHIFIALTYMFMLIFKNTEFINNIIYSTLLLIVYIYSFIVEKKAFFKYWSYIVTNFVLFTFFKFLNLPLRFLYYIPMLITLSIMSFEKIYTKIHTKGSDIFLIIAQSFSFLFVFIHIGLKDDILSSLLIIPFAIIVIIYNMWNQKHLYNIVPLLAIIPALLNPLLSTELQTGLMIITTFPLLSLSLFKKELSIYTIFSGLYLLILFNNIDSSYIKEVLAFIWATSHFFIFKENKFANLFKFLSYISVLFLYHTIIKDLKIDDITAISTLGVITVTILTLRTIIINYTKNIDVFEYITFAIIYLSILPIYTDAIDGMIFVCLIIAILFLAYLKRYGALFITTIFALFINIFVLTRQFWISVPWWIYLLAIGAILIAFAIRNEIKEEKDKINIGKLFKNLKEKVDNKEELIEDTKIEIKENNETK